MKSTIPATDPAIDAALDSVIRSRLGPPTEKPTESDSTPKLVDLDALGRRLEGLTDRRKRRGKRYSLAMLLLLVILAKLSGEDQPAGIADWIANRSPQLRGALGLSWNRMPHESTFRRLFEWMVSPEELDRVISEHVRSQEGVGRSVLISIDGKTVRGTIKWNESRGEHLLAAYLPEEGIVLMQVAAGEKDNEINAAPILLRSIDLRGKVVVGDAMHTQRALSTQILEAEADYLWFAKENQPTLREDIEQLFEASPKTVLGGRVENDFETFRTIEKGHGRLESREITVSSELVGHSDWPGIEQVFRLERRRADYRDGKPIGKEETEVVYGLTSLSREEASPERLLSLTRTYWGIENGLHGRRDVTFREDRTRLTRGKAGRVMASINNLVISLLRLSGHTNLAQARRRWDANLTLTLGGLRAS